MQPVLEFGMIYKYIYPYFKLEPLVPCSVLELTFDFWPWIKSDYAEYSNARSTWDIWHSEIYCCDQNLKSSSLCKDQFVNWRESLLQSLEHKLQRLHHSCIKLLPAITVNYMCKFMLWRLYKAKAVLLCQWSKETRSGVLLACSVDRTLSILLVRK